MDNHKEVQPMSVQDLIDVLTDIQDKTLPVHVYVTGMEKEVFYEGERVNIKMVDTGVTGTVDLNI